jgi:thiol peroxidase
MAKITFKDKAVNTNGNLPALGDVAPEFLLSKTDLSDITVNDLKGKRVVINIFPSIETPVCSMSVKRFNAEVEKLENTEVLCVSKDLPFAHARFNAEEEIKNVISVCELRDLSFGENYGVRIIDGPLAGLFARALVVLDENSRVVYTQLVSEISQEPDYDSVLTLLGSGSGNVEGCTKTSTAEHSRPGDDNEPCDDGMSG